MVTMGQSPKYIKGEKSKRQNPVSVTSSFEVCGHVLVHVCNTCRGIEMQLGTMVTSGERK